VIELLIDQNFNDMPIGQAIDELLIAVQCLAADECANLVRYFPM